MSTNQLEKELRNNFKKYKLVDTHDINSVNDDAYCHVLFNGNLATTCIKADSLEGWIEVIIFNGDDPYVNFSGKNPSSFTTKLYGDVKIFQCSRMAEVLFKNGKVSKLL